MSTIYQYYCVSCRCAASLCGLLCRCVVAVCVVDCVSSSRVTEQSVCLPTDIITRRHSSSSYSSRMCAAACDETAVHRWTRCCRVMLQCSSRCQWLSPAASWQRVISKVKRGCCSRQYHSPPSATSCSSVVVQGHCGAGCGNDTAAASKQ